MEKFRLTGFACPKCGQRDKLILIYTHDEKRKIICEGCGNDVTW